MTNEKKYEMALMAIASLLIEERWICAQIAEDTLVEVLGRDWRMSIEEDTEWEVCFTPDEELIKEPMDAKIIPFPVKNDE